MDFIDAVICKYPHSGNWYPGMSHIIVSLAYIQYLNHLGSSYIHHNIQVVFIKDTEKFFSNTLLFFIGSFIVVFLISNAWEQNLCDSTFSCTKGFYKKRSILLCYEKMINKKDIEENIQ